MIVYLLFRTNATDDRVEFVDVFSSAELARDHVQTGHPATEWFSSMESRWTRRDSWGLSYRFEIQERTVR